MDLDESLGIPKDKKPKKKSQPSKKVDTEAAAKIAKMKKAADQQLANKIMKLIFEGKKESAAFRELGLTRSQGLTILRNADMKYIDGYVARKTATVDSEIDELLDQCQRLIDDPETPEKLRGTALTVKQKVLGVSDRAADQAPEIKIVLDSDD